MAMEHLPRMLPAFSMTTLSSFLAAFSGTAVEFFETVAIAYAIIRAGYPREAIAALVLGHVAVFVLGLFLAPLHGLLPLFWMRLAAGLLLTAMGLHWTQKSLRRLWAGRRPRWAEDPLGKLQVTPVDAGTMQAGTAAFSIFVFFVMLKSSVVEASEILLVVFPIAAAHAAWAPVIWGLAAGIAAVTLVALLLHGQLRKVSEVKLKLVIGLLLTVLGTMWLVEMYTGRGGA